MPSRKGQRLTRVTSMKDRVREKSFTEENTSLRRLKNLVAGAEQKEKVLNTVVPMAAQLPPFLGEYTQEMGEALGDMIIEGATLDDLKMLPGCPPFKFLLRWIRDKQHPFHKIFYEAKEAQVALYEERIVRTAHKTEDQVILTTRQVLDSEDNIQTLVDERRVDNVQRSELKVKAMQWSLAWMQPRKHGRLALPDGDKPNDQLKKLFEALMSGPAKEDDDDDS